MKDKILVIDDDPAIVSLLQDFLEDEFDIEKAYCSEEALSTLMQKNQYSAILTDINLGGLSGLKLLEILKMRPGPTPIILMSADVKREDLFNAIHIGAFDVIEKPFELEKLYYTLGKAVHYYREQLQKESLSIKCKALIREAQELVKAYKKRLLKAENILMHTKSLTLENQTEVNQFLNTIKEVIEHEDIFHKALEEFKES